MAGKESSKFQLKELELVFPVFLCLVAFLQFIILRKTAFNWPAADMFPFFSRMKDPGFALNDFFTNASATINSRLVFGYFALFLSDVFALDWYPAIFMIKVCLVILTPVSYYLAIYLIAKRFVPIHSLKLLQVLLTLAILLIMMDRYNSLFSIAWWPPYYVESTSAVMAMVLGMGAIIFSELKSKIPWALSLLLFALSTFFHPAIGTFCIAFYFLSLLFFIKLEYRRMLVILLIGFILPVILQKILFSSSSQLDTKTFIEIYVLDNHPFHYHLSDLASSYPLWNWKLSFGILAGLMVVPFFISVYRKNLVVSILSLAYLFAYVACVAMQYLFIDVLPNKFVALLGPIRFSQFGYWMMALLWVITLSEWASGFSFVSKLNTAFSLFTNYIRIRSFLKWLFFGLLFITLVTTGLKLRDDPFTDIYSRDKPLYDFLKTTPEQSVFAIYKSPHTFNVPIVAKRAVFAGNGFPFNEDYIVEFAKRSSKIYGNYVLLKKEPYEWADERMLSFYRKLLPEDFAKIAKEYQLDYVMIEKQYSENFKKFKPVFEDKERKIYLVKDFKKF